jgi:hypothetical protein
MAVGFEDLRGDVSAARMTPDCQGPARPVAATRVGAGA